MKKYILVLLVLLVFGIILFILLNREIYPRLNPFTVLPNKLSGGACVYYLNDLDKEKAKYIFVNDYGEYGYAVIKNIDQEFKLKTYDLDSGLFVYNNEQYNLEVHVINRVSVGDEGSHIEGTVSVSSKNNKRVVQNVVGDCGN